jgi:hypothetical protein
MIDTQQSYQGISSVLLSRDTGHATTELDVAGIGGAWAHAHRDDRAGVEGLA